MTSDIVESISNHYIKLYKQITGETFVKTLTDNLPKRIEKNVTDFLKKK